MIKVEKTSIVRYRVTYPVKMRDEVAKVIDHKRICLDFWAYALPGDSGLEMCGVTVRADDADAIAVVEGLAKK